MYSTGVNRSHYRLFESTNVLRQQDAAAKTIVKFSMELHVVVPLLALGATLGAKVIMKDDRRSNEIANVEDSLDCEIFWV